MEEFTHNDGSRADTKNTACDDVCGVMFVISYSGSTTRSSSHEHQELQERLEVPHTHPFEPSFQIVNDKEGTIERKGGMSWQEAQSGVFQSRQFIFIRAMRCETVECLDVWTVVTTTCSRKPSDYFKIMYSVSYPVFRFVSWRYRIGHISWPSLSQSGLQTSKKCGRSRPTENFVMSVMLTVISAP